MFSNEKILVKKEREMRVLTKVFMGIIFLLVSVFTIFMIVQTINRDSMESHLFNVLKMEKEELRYEVPLPLHRSGAGFQIFICLPTKGEHIVVFSEKGKTDCEFGNFITSWEGDHRGLGLFKEK